jgi:hypothetical protein
MEFIRKVQNGTPSADTPLWSSLQPASLVLVVRSCSIQNPIDELIANIEKTDALSHFML